MDICNGQVFATNMTGSTSLGGVEGTGISNLVVHVTDCTLQFNHNYTMTMEVGEGDRSVLRLGDLSMLPRSFNFIGGPSIMHSCTTSKKSKNIILLQKDIKLYCSCTTCKDMIICLEILCYYSLVDLFCAFMY